jgi:ubiquinone/menaquinone biosynthesis C-methylase UbiE
MSIYSFLMARFYDAALRGMEQACLRDWRAELLRRAAGDVLELGSGTGLNLPHYPAGITSLTLTEPDPHMLRRLRQKLTAEQLRKVRVEGCAINNLPFPDHSFDTIVATLVLCSVASPASALKEIRRLLKPDGKFLFIEHVLAKTRPRLLRWQKLVQPVWIPLCGNCHLTRDTERCILESGFRIEQIVRRCSSGGPVIVSPTISGEARPSRSPTND